jgi:hypothetical protein
MKSAIISLVIILVISQVFVETLAYNIREEVPVDAFEDGAAERTGGLFGWGDVNSLGAGYVLFFALFLFIKVNYNYNVFSKLLLPVLMVGILYTISRGAILGLFISVGLYLLYSSSANRIRFAFYAAIGFVLLLMALPVLLDWELIQVTLERFSEIGTREMSASENTLRVGGWLYYLEYIFTHPIVFITGTTEPLLTSVFSYGYARVPHNIYITILFRAGLLFFFLYFYITVIMINKKSVIERSISIIYFPFLFMTFLLSDFGAQIIFIYALIATLAVKEGYVPPTTPVEEKTTERYIILNS